MKAREKLAAAVAALAPFERAYRELRFITVDDLKRAAEVHWKITQPISGSSSSPAVPPSGLAPPGEG